MKFIFAFSILLANFAAFGADTTPSTNSNKVTVAYFGRVSDAEFNEKIKPVFVEEARCKDCELINWTPYDKDQKYDDAKIVEKVSQLDSSVQIVFFDWNDKTTAKSDALVSELQKVHGRQQVLVASAGTPGDNDKTCPLNLTLFGKVDEAIIVGELIQKDILWPRCHYGPEMLTAVRPPREYMGKGFGPTIFVARFANNFRKKKPEEWVSYLRARKAKSRKIWPEIEEFFPR